MSNQRKKRKSRRDKVRDTALQELGSTGLELLSHGKIKVGKRMSQEDRERTQARVGLVSNVVGLAAAGAATGAALKNPALRRPSKADPGPVSGRVLRAANKGRFGRVGRVLRSPRGRAALIAGGAGSALGLQLANLGGDVVANRVLSREAGVSKSEFSMISKSDEVRVTGHGVNIEKRNFDAEADRQRRLGLYAGAGIGAGLVAGDATRRVVLANSKKVGDLYHIQDKRIANKRVYHLPKRRLDRVGLGLLAAGSVLGVGGGLAAYKRGIDERNNPWG